MAIFNSYVSLPEGNTKTGRATLSVDFLSCHDSLCHFPESKVPERRRQAPAHGILGCFEKREGIHQRKLGLAWFDHQLGVKMGNFDFNIFNWNKKKRGSR